MMCAFEAMVIRAENIEKREIEKELERIEQERILTEVSHALCEKVIAPLIEQKTQDTYNEDWGEITIRLWHDSPHGYLITTTTDDYVDCRTSYKPINNYYLTEKFINPTFDLKRIKEYLNSYCWDFDIEFFDGYMYGHGLIKLATLKFKPMPSCL